ncbi:hypothetical protein [Sodalinema gerasimenkoae]|uniref:hypothetical protein n=1 Tax=Sodalinema gerasimenkoae TaxID=2862348 RepID=UPI00135841B8|nr:hypothetical protein [Sodalinema gerasimenkoae]
MEFLIFLILVVVTYYYLKHQLHQHTIRQRKQKKELEEQNRRQKIQKHTSQLKTFVLNNYGADGGYWDFNVEESYRNDPTDDFTADGCNPKWKDRDGSTWRMWTIYSSTYSELGWPVHGPKIAHPDRSMVNKLDATITILDDIDSNVSIEKKSNGRWNFYIRRCWNGDDIRDYFNSCRSDYKGYDTPYQAKLAGQKFTNNALKSLGY